MTTSQAAATPPPRDLILVLTGAHLSNAMRVLVALLIESRLQFSDAVVPGRTLISLETATLLSKSPKGSTPVTTLVEPRHSQHSLAPHLMPPPGASSTSLRWTEEQGVRETT